MAIGYPYPHIYTTTPRRPRPADYESRAVNYVTATDQVGDGHHVTTPPAPVVELYMLTKDVYDKPTNVQWKDEKGAARFYAYFKKGACCGITEMHDFYFGYGYTAPITDEEFSLMLKEIAPKHALIHLTLTSDMYKSPFQPQWFIDLVARFGKSSGDWYLNPNSKNYIQLWTIACERGMNDCS